ncbi:MAG: peptidylprolyl isomerase [Bacteroidales bacterium]|nr:peptidylprolyl isomerase [Bacteroidales bacterium]
MNKTVILFAISFLWLSSCSHSPNPLILIETDLGPIEAEIYLKEAPITAANFLYHIDVGTFQAHETVFYRVVRSDNQPYSATKIEVIQGGLYDDELIDAITPIAHETTQTTGIKHTDGVLSMARNEPGTASTEFFICIGDQPGLDYGGSRNSDGQGFATFGKVTKGMDVVKIIQMESDSGQYLLEPVRIRSIRRI